MITPLTKFASVGLLATLGHVSLAITSAHLFRLQALSANLMGFCAAVAISYFGHANFTFGVVPDHKRHLPRFIIAAAIGLAASSSITWILSNCFSAPFWLAMLVTALFVPLLNFLVLRLWVFATNSDVNTAGTQRFLVASICSVGTLIILWGHIVNHDVAWFLVATQKWIRGAALYRDIVEINPPLMFYLTLPAIAIMRAFHITPFNAFYVFFSSLIFGMVFLSYPILIRTQSDSRVRAALFLLIVTAEILILGISEPINDLGQRDQLFAILVLPWLLSRSNARAQQDTRYEVGLALLAAVGICLKPYFLCLPIFVTAYLVVTKKSLQPIFSQSNVILGCVGIVYVTCVLIFYPIYFTEIVPTARLVYGAYNFGASGFIKNLRLPVIMMVVLATAAIVIKRSILAILSAATFAGLVSFLLQGTGFRYQVLPCAIFAATGLTWIAVYYCENRIWRIIAAFLLLLGWKNVVVVGFPRNQSAAELSDQLRGYKSVSMFTTDLYTGQPAALISNIQWASRYPALWPVPGAMNRLYDLDCGREVTKCSDLKAVLNKTRGDIVSDLKKFKPEILVFEEGSIFFRSEISPFDWIGFMERDPEFQDVIGNYHFDKKFGQYEIWVNSTIHK